MLCLRVSESMIQHEQRKRAERKRKLDILVASTVGVLNSLSKFVQEEEKRQKKKKKVLVCQWRPEPKGFRDSSWSDKRERLQYVAAYEKYLECRWQGGGGPQTFQSRSYGSIHEASNSKQHMKYSFILPRKHQNNSPQLLRWHERILPLTPKIKKIPSRLCTDKTTRIYRLQKQRVVKFGAFVCFCTNWIQAGAFPMYSNVAKLCCFSSSFKVDWLFQEVFFFLLLLYVVSFFLFRVASFSPSQKYVQVWNKFVKKKKRKKRESIKTVASILYVKKKKRKPKLLTYLRFDLIQDMYPGFLLCYFKTL